MKRKRLTVCRLPHDTIPFSLARKRPPTTLDFFISCKQTSLATFLIVLMHLQAYSFHVRFYFTSQMSFIMSLVFDMKLFILLIDLECTRLPILSPFSPREIQQVAPYRRIHSLTLTNETAHHLAFFVHSSNASRHENLISRNYDHINKVRCYATDSVTCDKHTYSIRLAELVRVEKRSRRNIKLTWYLIIKIKQEYFGELGLVNCQSLILVSSEHVEWKFLCVCLFVLPVS